ncbi:MAG: TonB family protein [Terriglobales bacterium]
MTILCGAIAAQSTGGSNASSKTSNDSDRYAGPVYKNLGGGISPPRVKESGLPELTKDEATALRKDEKHQSVVLSLVIDPEGNPRNVKVDRSLSPGLDQKALESVKKWKFDPA